MYTLDTIALTAALTARLPGSTLPAVSGIKHSPMPWVRQLNWTRISLLSALEHCVGKVRSEGLMGPVVVKQPASTSVSA